LWGRPRVNTMDGTKTAKKIGTPYVCPDGMTRTPKVCLASK